jgi:hypothetical protein
MEHNIPIYHYGRWTVDIQNFRYDKNTKTFIIQYKDLLDYYYKNLQSNTERDRVLPGSIRIVNHNTNKQEDFHIDMLLKVSDTVTIKSQAGTRIITYYCIDNKHDVNQHYNYYISVVIDIPTLSMLVKGEQDEALINNIKSISI